MKLFATLAIALLTLAPNLSMASKNSGAPDPIDSNTCDTLQARLHQTGSVVFFHKDGSTTLHYASAASCRNKFGEGPGSQASPALVPADDTKTCSLGFVCAGDSMQ